MSRWTFKIGLSLVILFIALAIFAPWLRLHSPDQFFLDAQLALPSKSFWFGQDAFGRCIYSRILYGARVSMGIGLAVVSISLAIGLIIGIGAGWKGGVFDLLFSFVSDIFLAFPGFLLAIALAAFIGPSIKNVIFVLSFLGWVGYARLARGLVLGLKEKEYVSASFSLGASSLRLILKHLLPNMLGPMMVQATFGMAGVILVESSLSFLGVGIPVEIPSWGNMLDQGVSYLLIAPHLSIFPGLFIMGVVLGFNFLGDGLRDRWDPR